MSCRRLMLTGLSVKGRQTIFKLCLFLLYKACLFRLCIINRYIGVELALNSLRMLQ